MTVELRGFVTDLGILVPYYKVNYTLAQLQAELTTSKAIINYPWGVNLPLVSLPGLLEDVWAIIESSWRERHNVTWYMGPGAATYHFMLDGVPVAYNSGIGNRITATAGSFEWFEKGDLDFFMRTGSITPQSWGVTPGWGGEGEGFGMVASVAPVPRLADEQYYVPSNASFPGFTLLTSDGRLTYASVYSHGLFGGQLTSLSLQVNPGPLGGIDRGYDNILIKTLGEEERGAAMLRYNPRLKTTGIGAYPLTKEQVNRFKGDLWTSNFAEAILSMVAGDGTKSVLGLMFYPGLKHDLVLSDTPSYITVGNVHMKWDSDAVTTTPILEEFVIKSLASVTVPADSGSYLDFTEATYVANIPWLGHVDLNANDVVGKTVYLTYLINVTDGSAVAYLSHEDLRVSDTTDSVFFTASCQWGYNYPITGDVAGSNGIAMAINTALSFVGIGGLASAAGTPSVGSLDPNTGYMGDLEAKIIAYNKSDLSSTSLASATGLPDRTTGLIGNQTGYIQCKAVYGSGDVPARARDRIVAKLQEGVYL